MPGKTYDHSATIAWLRAKGVNPHEDYIQRLSLAANCAKHGPGRACDQLRAANPALFGEYDTGYPGYARGGMQIRSADVEDFFAALRASGPT